MPTVTIPDLEDGDVTIRVGGNEPFTFKVSQGKTTVTNDQAAALLSHFVNATVTDEPKTTTNPMKEG